MDTVIVHCTGLSDDFVDLCGQLDRYLAFAAEDAGVQERFDTFNRLDDIHDSFVAYLNGRPVGCAAFRRFDATVAELKRMFVRDDCREHGVGRKLLAAVEAAVLEKGYTACVLETGRHLHGARALYLKAGFREIERYGVYKDIPISICMRKEIGS